MRFVLFIARRYLFSKKSTNAINVVSAISVAGIVVGTMALVCVMSVMNGFEGLVTQMFSEFDPDLKIRAARGKHFVVDTDAMRGVRELDNVAYFSEVVEESALLYFDDRQVSATVKGVDSVFAQVANIDSIIQDGEFLTYDGAFERGVAGAGLAAKLGLGAHFIDPVRLYAPRRKGTVNMLRPEGSFNQASLFMAGVFAVNQVEYDDHYLLVSMGMARSLFDYADSEVTAVELRVQDKKRIDETQAAVCDLLGEEYVVQNQYEQQEDFYRILEIEKWMTFFILAFILLIATFNIIGSLSMLIIDKKEDIRTLQHLGATRSVVRMVFLLEGWMISMLGALLGALLGVLVCLIQEHFGVISMGPGFVIDAYPVAVQAVDVMLILLVVFLLGFVAAWYPARHASVSTARPQQ